MYTAVRDYVSTARLSVGSPVPTTHELARQFKVSYVTMHSALDDLVRDGWLVRHQGKGTFVAGVGRLKARSATSHLVMVLPPQEDIRRSGHTEVVLNFVHGCTHGANAVGADLAMASLPSVPESSDIAGALPGIMRYDGAIFVGEQFEPLMRRLKQQRFPYVMLGGENQELGCIVNYDQRMGVRMAAEHLLGHGYRRIGFFGRTSGFHSVKADYFRETLARHGVKPPAEWVVECADFPQAADVARALLSQGQLPEAVVVDNYYKAEILVRAMEFRELYVPRDLAVMAYGTEHAGGLRSPLSMLKVPAYEMGRQAASLLEQLIRGKALPPVRKNVAPSLVIRGSCGCVIDQSKAVNQIGSREGVLV